MTIRTLALAAVLTVSLVGGTSQVWAVEYRLQVVSVYDDAFLSQLKADRHVFQVPLAGNQLAHVVARGERAGAA